METSGDNEAGLMKVNRIQLTMTMIIRVAMILLLVMMMLMPKNKEQRVVVHVFSDIVFASQCLCHSTTSLEGDDEDENADERKKQKLLFYNTE